MTAPTVPAQPVLTTVPNVELGAVGRWRISNIPDWQPTADDMASAVAALGCPAVRRPILKIGHDGNHGHGDPALGYIDNLAVTGDGQVLVGDFAGIPSWLAAEDSDGHSVLSSAYPDRSGEWQHNYVCQLGHTHPFVLHAMALLGVARPGIGTLQSLHDLYTTAPAKEPLMPAASLPSADGTVASAATTEDVRRAYYAGPGSNWNLYIREMYVDPAELIVQDDQDDTLTRVSYTIGADGEVTFGDPQTVKVQYVDARAAAGQPVIAWASAVESRPAAATPPVTPETTPPARRPAAAPTPQKGAGMDPARLAKLREAYDLPADAPEADVVAAMAKDVPPPAPDPAPDPGGGDPVLPPVVPTPVSAGDSEAVLLDPVQYKALQAQAARGDEAWQRMKAAECDSVLDAAIKVGKFPPARRDHYAARWASDPDGTKEEIGRLQPGVIPVSVSGYAGVSDETAEEALYRQLYPERFVDQGVSRG